MQMARQLFRPCFNRWLPIEDNLSCAITDTNFTSGNCALFKEIFFYTKLG